MQRHSYNVAAHAADADPDPGNLAGSGSLEIPDPDLEIIRDPDPGLKKFGSGSGFEKDRIRLI